MTPFRKALPLALTSLLPVALFAACGGGEEKPPEVPVTAAPEVTQRPEGPKLQMSSELGSIDEKETNAVFDKASSQLNACYKEGRKHLSFLSGDIKFFLRITEAGTVKFAQVEGSTLGDRSTELCMMEALRNAPWPKPTGGEAEVRKSFGFDPPSNVRAPVAWNSDKLAEPLSKIEKDIGKCKKSSTATFLVTAHVHPDGKHGKIEIASIVPSTREAELVVDCLLEALKDMKGIPSPGSYPAKVSFNL